MVVRITIRDKEYISRRVVEEYGPMVRRLNDTLIPIRTTVRNELLESLGINHIEEAIKSLDDQIVELKRQRSVVMGTRNTYGVSPFERRIDDVVQARPEAKALRLVQKQQKEAQDRVMIAGFPEDLKIFLENLPKDIANLTQKVKQLTDGEKL